MILPADLGAPWKGWQGAEISGEPAPIAEGDESGRGGRGETWSDPKCILKVVSTGFADGLEARGEREKSQGDALVFSWKN